MYPEITDVKVLQTNWRKKLEDLPATPDKIPSFFFGHGTPVLEFPASNDYSRFGEDVTKWAGAEGPLAAFLKDFSPALLKKYQPKGIVVFSAHWETNNECLEPLPMDYYGFQPELYQLKFKSKGDSALSRRVVELYKEVHTSSDVLSTLVGPGLDHGVFIPFRFMFGDEFIEIPIVEVSIDSSLSPEINWTLGRAVAKLWEEGILILSGGLTVHNLRDLGSFAPSSAQPAHKVFDQAVLAAVVITDETECKTAMVNLTKHAGFHASHPRDHFIPLYVAAGVGKGGNVKVIADIYGGETVAFGL
ncbi:Extradiol ring-cleavage dioxygenase, class III enzyme, subunit B [Mycena alexandri]|uniref:Extradiol ring-cleavage dioxygenase, class III enzyme, subunit B n=1 Tax=Mycena alexandri TaxID=1745969 RepID=A0AAD6S398_9AGAR|nr:Extradiol ring-cleavage dioxygenase, class III enzyme, subunit B [Mycena alexandri]